MPTIAELITTTTTKLAQAEAQIVAARTQLSDVSAALDAAEHRRAVLAERLAMLKTLAAEGV